MDNQFTNKLKNIQSRLEVDNHAVQRESILRISSLLCDPASNLNTVRNNHLLQILLKLLPTTNSIYILESVLNSLNNAVQNNRIQRMKLIETLVNTLPAISCGSVGVDLVVGELVRNMVEVDVLNMKQQAILSAIKNSNSLDTVLSFIKYIELVLLEESIDLPQSLVEQRWRALHPLVNAIFIKASTLPSGISSLVQYQLVNQLSRVAHNSSVLHIPILSSLSSLLFYINNSSNNIIMILRDIIDLIRFVDESLLVNSNVKQVWESSIHRVAYYLVQTIYSSTVDISSAPSIDVGLLINILVELIDVTDKSSLICNTTISNCTTTTTVNAPLIVVLAYILPKLLRQHQLLLLELLTTVVIDYNVNDVQSLTLLFFPLIRIQSSIPNESYENKVNSLAFALIRHIEIVIYQQQQQDQQKQQQQTIQLDIVPIESISLLNTSYQFYINFNQSSLNQFFNSLEKKINVLKTKKDDKSMDCDLLLFILSSFLFNRDLQQHSIQTRSRVVSLLALITHVDSIQSISLLPLFMQRLRYEESGEVIKQLYHSLTELAGHRICYPVVVKLINDMSAKKSLVPIAIRLMTKVCFVNSKALTSLQEMLSTVKPDTSQLEERIAAAASIRDICEYDSDAGQDMISPLSVLLCRDTHPTVLSLTLDALGILCQSEVLSFVSAWNVIKKNFTVDTPHTKHPLVAQHLIQFFRNGTVELESASMETIEEKKADILRDIVSRVWSYTVCGQNFVEREAFITLGSYAEADPALVEIDLNTLVSSNNMALSEELLNRALVKELNEKRTLKSAHTNLRQTKSIRIGDAVDDIEPMLYKEYTQELRVGITQGVLAGLLWSFSNQSMVGQDGGNRESKKLIALRYKAFTKVLMDLTSLDLSASRADDFTSRLMTIGGWNRFMSECIEACLRYEQAKMALAKDKNQSSMLPNLVRDKVFDDLYKLLLDHVDQISNNQITINQSENIVLALSGLGKSLPQSSYNKLEQVVAKLLDWLNAEKPIISKAACYLGIANLITSLTDDSPLQVQSKQALLWGESSATEEQTRFSWYIAIGIASMNLAKSNKLNLLEPILTMMSKHIASSELEVANLNDRPDQIALIFTLGYIAYSLKEINTNTFNKLLVDINGKMDKLFGSSEELAKSAPQILGALLLALPSVKTVMFKLSIIDSNQINNLIKKLDDQRQSYPKLKLFTCLSHSLLIQSLASESYALDIDYIESQIKQYIHILSNVSSSTNDRIAAIISASVFLGAPILTQDINYAFSGNLVTGILDFINSNPTRRKECQSLIQQLIDTIIQIYNTSDDSKVVRFASACLGALASPTSSTTSNDTPENLDHLPEDTLVKKLFNVLNNTTTSTDQQIASVLSIFAQVDGTKLPIVNWGSLIKRIFTSNQNELVRSKCIEFCANNILLSTCSSIFIEWTNMIQTYSSSLVKEKLLRSIPKTVAHVAVSRVDSLFRLLEDVVKVYTADGNTTEEQQLLSKNLQLTWQVIFDGLKSDLLPAEMRQRFRRLAIDHISKSIPLPFDDKQNLDLNVLESLDQCATGLSTLPDKKFGFELISGSNNNLESFQNSLKMNYVFSRWAKLSNVPITLQSIGVLKQWCFTCNGSPYQQMLRPFLPSITENLFVAGSEPSNRPALQDVIIDFLDCLKLSPKHSMGIELLSSVIINKLSEINFNILFSHIEINNLYPKQSISNLSNILAYLLPIVMDKFNLNSIVSDRLCSLVKDKFNSIDKSEKAILTRSLLSISQISNIPEPIQSWILNGLQ